MKTYNFWFVNSKHEVMQQFNKENPFSGINGTLKDAEIWAENLLDANKDESKVEFMAVNGRKVYTMYKWFDESGNLLGEIPQNCINDCTHAGDCIKDVQYWVKKLNFIVPADMARKYLSEFGAWEDLEDCTQELLNERALWVVCCDIKESGEFYGLQY